MSDFDDLEDQIPNLAADGNFSRRGMSSKRNCKKLHIKIMENNEKNCAPGMRLRLSAHEPSLPKLKCLDDRMDEHPEKE